MSVDNPQEKKLTIKRKYPRVAMSNLLYYEFLDADGQSIVQSHGKTVSLSEGGMLFQSDRIIASGTSVDLQFTLAENLINAKGEVIYYLEKSEQRYNIGLRFTEISEDHVLFIREKATGIFPLFRE